MKKSILIFSMFMVFMTSCGKKNKEIIGRYRQDGANYFILENNQFIIVAYATLIYGKWEVDNNNNLTLSPKNPEHRFVLYGRHNPNIKKGYKIMFTGFEEDETFFSNDKETKMINVFNSDANCFSFPYVYEFKDNSKFVTFCYKVYSEDENDNLSNNSYSFPTTTDNDFLVSYTEDSKLYKPFYFKIVKGGLQKDSYHDIIKKVSSASIGDDDKKMLVEIQNQINKSDNDKTEVIKYKNFNYQKINPQEIKSSVLKRGSESLFHAVCKEDKVEVID
jgi:hypothetical protein